MTFLSIVWDADPVFFSLGPLTVRWYGLMFLFSFLSGFFIMKRFFNRENIPIPELDSLLIYVMLGTVIGARLGHCFFYQPDYYLKNPMDILKTWEGGLASHGAAIGILLSLWMFSKRYSRPYLWIVDRVVIVVALSGFFIRIGNFINSEIYGHQTDLPWGIIFKAVGEVIPKHPTQIYEAFACIITFMSLLWVYKYYKAQAPHGLLFGLFLVCIFGFRFFIEYIKEVQVAFEEKMALDMGQILSIPFVIVGIGLIIYSLCNTQNTGTVVLSKLNDQQSQAALLKKGRKAR